MSQRTRLFCLKDPYDLPASDAQFIRAVRENCSFHYTHCLEYRRLLLPSKYVERLRGSGASPFPAHGYL